MELGRAFSWLGPDVFSDHTNIESFAFLIPVSIQIRFDQRSFWLHIDCSRRVLLTRSTHIPPSELIEASHSGQMSPVAAEGRVSNQSQQAEEDEIPRP